jgi:hypothetical protein
MAKAVRALDQPSGDELSPRGADQVGLVEEERAQARRARAASRRSTARQARAAVVVD